MTRRVVGIAAVAALLLVAALVQVGLLAALPLPGATPDLVLVLVVGLGLVRGASAGALAGAGGGLLLDLVPPAPGTAGQWMLVLTLAGYVAGSAGRADLRPVVRPLVPAALAALATAAYVAVSALLGLPVPTAADLAVLVGTAALYAGVLGVVLLPGTAWLVARAASTPRTAW